MTSPMSPYFYPEHMVHAVTALEAYRQRVGDLASHPYNQDHPDLSVWWLFKRSRKPWGLWPAYSVGKYFFDKPAGRGMLRAGIHIEKGLSTEAASSLFSGAKAKQQQLTKDWCWYRLLEAIRTG